MTRPETQEMKGSVRLEGNLLDRVPEVLALEGSKLELERGRLPRAVGASKGASTPWRATTDLSQVRELGKGGGVTEGHEDDAVVGERRDGVQDGALCVSVRIIDGERVAGTWGDGLYTPWPPPGVPVETKMLAYLPARAPWAQSWPVWSQKACNTTLGFYANAAVRSLRTFHWPGKLP